MKKLTAIILSAGLIMSTSSVFAEDIKVTINNAPVDFDVQPQFINDRTMVPMRKIFESLGAEVQYLDQAEAIVATKDSKIILMGIGSTSLSIADVITSETNTITLDVAPVEIDGRTLVPVRAVSDALDMSVEWNDETQTVIITSK